MTSDPRLIVSGPAVFAVKARHIIQHDAQVLSIIAASIVVLFLWLMYRSVFFLFLILIPIGSAILIASAIVGLTFHFIHGITLAFGVTLIGVTVDYPLHIFSHLVKGQDPDQVVQNIWPTLRLGMLTTAAGFAPMLFSETPGLEQLGCFAIVGLLIAGMVSRWVLPSLIPSGYVPQAYAVGFTPWCTWRKKEGCRGVVLLLMLTSVAVFYSIDTVWETDIAQLSPISEEQKNIDRTLRESLGAPDTRDLIVITAPTSQQVLEVSETLIPILDKSIQNGRLKGYDLAAKYLPSIRTQNTRQKDLPDYATLQDRLHQALVGLPFAEGIFAPFIQAVHRSRQLPVLDLSHLQGMQLGAKIEPLLFTQDNDWIGLVLLQGVTTREFLRSGNLLPPKEQVQISYIDLKQESNKLLTHNRDKILSLVGWGALGIIIILWIGLGSFRGATQVFLPMCGGVVIAVSFLLVFGYRLSVFHIACLLLVVGIGLDYALFYNRNPRNPQEFARTLFSILVCCGTTICGFGILAFSETPVLKAIGLTVFFGALACLLFTACTSRKTVETS